MEMLFMIAILIMSVVLHEVSHGYAAYYMGDPTAKYAGRLTLNPIHHLDLFGSFLLPLLTYLTAGFVIGYAKPVPYNPYNLKNQKWGPAIVGVAGPAANLFLVLFFGLLIRLGVVLPIFPYIVLINLVLMVFNLLPIPPLDGSKVLFAVLPYEWKEAQDVLERYGFFILLFFIFFIGGRLIWPVVSWLFLLITGAQLM
ncbi:MAG: site-2 protease family protein [Patescibacteria group bacterium]